MSAPPSFVTPSPPGSLQYVSWQPSGSENFLIPAVGARVIQGIAVTASPFIFVAPQDVLVLIGGGLITSIAYEGIYPPNTRGQWGNGPTPGTSFTMEYNHGNDFAIGVFQGDEIIVTYTQAPQMYYVH